MTSPTPPSTTTALSTALWRRPRLRLFLLLVLPVALLVLIYGGSLVALLLQSFYSLDAFTGTIQRTFVLSSWRGLFTDSNLFIITRTVLMAVAVTIAAAVLALPLSYVMSRVVSRRIRTLMVLGVMVPLWSSYLVRVYSWKLILSAEGIVNWTLDIFRLGFVLDGVLALPIIGGPSLSFSPLGQFVVFVYIWLPYMIMPIQTSMDRVPSSLLEASGDLGASPTATFRRVLWPLVIPGVAAGSIFTFSLTLGDYIIPTVIGNSRPSIGLVIYSQQGLAGNLPAAAVFSFVPIVVMGFYLAGARRLGAFDAL